MYVSPQLRPLVRALRQGLLRSAHPWAAALRWVLLSRVIIVIPLPRSLGGFTNPLLPVIVMSSRYCADHMPRGDLALNAERKLLHAGTCMLAQTLVHEAAHQLWAVWPEWRLWLRWLGVLPGLGALRQVYGPQINAADAVSEAVCREICAQTRYPELAAPYRGPLHWLHPVFRR
jgi:hypothetical protein